MKLKLYRDRVVSVVRGKELVGVYINTDEDLPKAGREILLGEFSPFKADKIIKLWNMNLIDNGEKITL